MVFAVNVWIQDQIILVITHLIKTKRKKKEIIELNMLALTH